MRMGSWHRFSEIQTQRDQLEIWLFVQISPRWFQLVQQKNEILYLESLCDSVPLCRTAVGPGLREEKKDVR